jgi:hypothetical protein
MSLQLSTLLNKLEKDETPNHPNSILLKQHTRHPDTIKSNFKKLDIKYNKDLSKLFIKLSFNYIYYIKKSGDQIEISCPPCASEDAISHYFLTKTVIPLALSMKGEIVLHASAYSINEEGHLIIGDSGSGKSTLAIQAMLKGGKHIADDVIILTQKNGQIFLHPSKAGALLNKDIYENLKELHELPATLNPFKNKWNIRLANSRKEPCALKYLTILKHLLNKNNKKEVFKCIMKSTYFAPILKTKYASKYFQIFDTILNKVPLKDSTQRN